MYIYTVFDPSISTVSIFVALKATTFVGVQNFATAGEGGRAGGASEESRAGEQSRGGNVAAVNQSKLVGCGSPCQGSKESSSSDSNNNLHDGSLLDRFKQAISLVVDGSKTLSLGVEASISGWLVEELVSPDIDYDIGGSTALVIDFDSIDVGFSVTRSAGGGVGVAMGSRFASIGFLNLVDMAGQDTSGLLHVWTYGGGATVNDAEKITSLNLKAGLGLEAQVMRNATSVWSVRQAIKARSVSGGWIDSGCSNLVC
ncbi:hypothetical protein ACJJIW_16680 [Microbulbifer sp. JMSA004]|uniref:hypothetical protein n=1 Tax=Microbulbifer sp. JMSA004 TaxID=3243370 RepID=UPI00403A79C0